MADPTKIYWDSCAWIGLVNGEAGRKHALEAIYGQARSGLIHIWTSTISIVEANRLEAEMGMEKPIPPESIKVLDDLLFQPFVMLAPVDTDIAIRARKLLRETPKLSKKPDAIHLATAIRWDVPILHTYDGNDLLHLNGKKTCDNGEPLSITLPKDPFSGGLFAQEPA